MSSRVDRKVFAALGATLAQEEPPETSRDRKLEVNVLFTDTRGTLAALQTAGTLARNLGASINIVVAQAVPYVLPLERPPVSVAFTEQELLELVSQGAQGPLETNVQLYLCRDKRQTLLQVLRPKSLVVVGGRTCWWPTWETRLAKALWSRGCHVILADPK